VRPIFDFRWGCAPDPAGGAYSAPPDILILVVFKGAYLRGGRGGKVKEGPPNILA